VKLGDRGRLSQKKLLVVWFISDDEFNTSSGSTCTDILFLSWLHASNIVEDEFVSLQEKLTPSSQVNWTWSFLRAKLICEQWFLTTQHVNGPNLKASMEAGIKDTTIIDWNRAGSSTAPRNRIQAESCHSSSIIRRKSPSADFLRKCCEDPTSKRYLEHHLKHLLLDPAITNWRKSVICQMVTPDIIMANRGNQIQLTSTSTILYQ
jgi:hypothetical protein